MVWRPRLLIKIKSQWNSLHPEQHNQPTVASYMYMYMYVYLPMCVPGNGWLNRSSHCSHNTYVHVHVHALTNLIHKCLCDKEFLSTCKWLRASVCIQLTVCKLRIIIIDVGIHWMMFSHMYIVCHRSLDLGIVRTYGQATWAYPRFVVKKFYTYIHIAALHVDAVMTT